MYVCPCVYVCLYICPGHCPDSLQPADNSISGHISNFYCLALRRLLIQGKSMPNNLWKCTFAVLPLPEASSASPGHYAINMPALALRKNTGTGLSFSWYWILKLSGGEGTWTAPFATKDVWELFVLLLLDFNLLFQCVTVWLCTFVHETEEKRESYHSSAGARLLLLFKWHFEINPNTGAT